MDTREGYADRASDGSLTGRWIRQYQLLEPLGGGSFGTVYRARHRDLRIDRAFKVLRETVGLDPEVRARFRQEAQTAAHLRHPNIVPVYDVFDADGLLCIVMELVDPWTLADRVRTDGPLPPAEAGRVSLQLGAALDHAHARGIVHCDVKPGNVMLRRPDQTPLLTDFGIASVRAPGEAEQPPGMEAYATPGQTLGTVAYMSPEQFGVTGAPPDWRSDVYALAAVCYEMVTGQPPYGRGPEAVSGHLGQRPLTPASARNPALPAGVDAVLEQGLARDPARRPASAGDLARRFAAVLTGQPVDAVTEILLGSDVVAAAAARRRTLRRTAGRRSRSRTALVAGALLAALLLLAVPAVVVLARGGVVAGAERPAGLTDQVVLAAVTGHLDRCFDPENAPPWTCPRLQSPKANLEGWQVRGDPAAGATVRYDNRGDFTVHGHFVAVLVLPIDAANVMDVDAGPFVASVHWDGQALQVLRIDRTATGPPVPPFLLGDGAVLHAAQTFLDDCAAQTPHQLGIVQGCPYHLIGIDSFIPCNPPNVSDLVVFWKQGSDPGAGATVSYDQVTGLYRVTGRYALTESIVQPASCRATASMQGTYELLVTWERDRDESSHPAFLRFRWT